LESYAYVADGMCGLQIYRNLHLSGMNENEIKQTEIKTNNYFVKYDVSTVDLYFGASKESNLDLSIYDKTGREVKKLYSGKADKGYTKVTIKKNEYATGEYFIIGNIGETKVNTKVLILK